MKKWNPHAFIHGFALLHAGTVALCAWLGIPDTLALTALTMLMAVLLCYEENLTVDISIMALILVNVLGFLLGNLGAQLLLNFLPSAWKNIVATVLVTEMMGWALFWFAHTFSPANAASYDRKLSWKRRRGLLVGSIACWWAPLPSSLACGSISTFPIRAIFSRNRPLWASWSLFPWFCWGS